MTMHEIFSLISIFLTFPTLTTALAVVAKWWCKARHLVFRPGKNMASTDWFIRGVFKGFLKDFFDNGYWLIPWTLVFLQSEHASIWIMTGVYFNCVVRQGLGILAARCHLNASQVYAQEAGSCSGPLTFRTAFLFGCMLGLFYLLVILNYSSYGRS